MVVIDGLNQNQNIEKSLKKDLTFQNCVLYYIRHKIQRNRKPKISEKINKYVTEALEIFGITAIL